MLQTKIMKHIITPVIIVMLCFAVVGIASAQTMSTTSTTTNTTTPGLPDTGIGTDIGGNTALNIGLIVAALVVILGGAALMASQRSV